MLLLICNAIKLPLCRYYRSPRLRNSPVTLRNPGALLIDATNSSIPLAATARRRNRSTGQNNYYVQYTRLLEALLTNYSAVNRPVVDEEHMLSITMSMGLNQILELVSTWLCVGHTLHAFVSITELERKTFSLVLWYRYTSVCTIYIYIYI